jgi:hypothetical protein
VIDCLVNDWVKALLDAQTLIRKDIEALPAGQVHSKEAKEKIITELRRLNTPAASQLANQLEAES